MPHKPIIFWHHRPSSSWSQEQPLNTLRVFSKISLENQCKEIVLQKTVLALPFYYAEMRQKKLTRVTGSFFIKPVLFSDCSCSTKKKKKKRKAIISNKNACPVPCVSKNSRCNPSQPQDSILQKPGLLFWEEEAASHDTLQRLRNALPGTWPLCSPKNTRYLCH